MGQNTSRGAGAAGRAGATQVARGETTANRALNEYIRRLPQRYQQNYARSIIRGDQTGNAFDRFVAAGGTDAESERIIAEVNARTRNRQLAGARRRRRNQ